MILDEEKEKSKAVQEDPSKFEIFLGVFNNQKFSWFSISRHSTLEEGYKAFKKYVNKQLQYSDEELKRVWDTGRLDVELKNGNKTLNWVAIYCRETKKMSEPEKQHLEKTAETVEETEEKSGKAQEEKTAEKKDSGRLLVDYDVEVKMSKDRDFADFVLESYREFLDSAEDKMYFAHEGVAICIAESGEVTRIFFK